MILSAGLTFSILGESGMRVIMPVGFPYDEVSARTEHQEEKRKFLQPG